MWCRRLGIVVATITLGAGLSAAPAAATGGISKNVGASHHVFHKAPPRTKAAGAYSANDSWHPDLCAKYGIPECTNAYSPDWNATHFWDSAWVGPAKCPAGSHEATQTEVGDLRNAVPASTLVTSVPHYTATPGYLNDRWYYVINDTPVPSGKRADFVLARACSRDPNWWNQGNNPEPVIPAPKKEVKPEVLSAGKVKYTCPDDTPYLQLDNVWYNDQVHYETPDGKPLHDPSYLNVGPENANGEVIGAEGYLAPQLDQRVKIFCAGTRELANQD